MVGQLSHHGEVGPGEVFVDGKGELAQRHLRAGLGYPRLLLLRGEPGGKVLLQLENEGSNVSRVESCYDGGALVRFGGENVSSFQQFYDWRDRG